MRQIALYSYVNNKLSPAMTTNALRNPTDDHRILHTSREKDLLRIPWQ